MLEEVTLAGVGEWMNLGGLVVAGAVAAMINTMAGGGSLLILPLLLAMGLTPGMANGTVRVGTAIQNLSAVITFHRQGVHHYGLLGRLVGPVVLGAMVGTGVATRVPDEALRRVFGVMLAGWAVVLVLRPGRFLHPPAQPRATGVVAFVLAAVVGFYGGFLQAGVGFPMLALLVLYLGYPAVEANAVKVGLVLAYTSVSLPMFARAGQVAWPEGLALAVGAIGGGWLGARWQIKVGAGVVRWFVVVMVAVSGVVMLQRAWLG